MFTTICSIRITYPSFRFLDGENRERSPHRPTLRTALISLCRSSDALPECTKRQQVRHFDPVEYMGTRHKLSREWNHERIRE